MNFTHASLFSGIGGFDLAAEWMGWENVFHCEWNDFGKRVLNYYWPKAISYGDITKTDFTIHRGSIDILTGGFPCQPYSMAGKRLGKEDDRHLWPEMLRAIREIQPRFIVGENVYGLVNWNGGLVFDEVQADLEAEGYEVQPVILPACAVGAPHRRERIWFVAYSDKCTTGPSRTSGKTKSNGSKNNDEPGGRRQQTKQYTRCSYVQRVNSDPSNPGIKSLRPNRENSVYGLSPTSDTNTKRRKRSDRIQESIRFNPGTWNNWPTVEPTIRGGNDGISRKLDGITFPKWRNESIKAYGNAIVPQVAHQIFKAIQKTIE